MVAILLCGWVRVGVVLGSCKWRPTTNKGDVAWWISRHCRGGNISKDKFIDGERRTAYLSAIRRVARASDTVCRVSESEARAVPAQHGLSVCPFLEPEGSCE